MAKNKKYNLDEAPTRNADGSYNINYNGNNYTIQPSALNSGNITVTTPEVIVKGKRPYSPYSFGTYVPFEYSRNSYYRPEDALEAFNTITGGGLNWIDPTQWARRAIDLVPLATGDMSMSEYGDRWINGNEGLVTANFAKNHPIASMLFNGVVGGLPYAKALNYTTRAKPIYERIVQPGMRLFNSPLTGNWTKIGKREYRLSPNSLGANGALLESREPSLWIKELPLDESRYYRQVKPDALDSYKANGVVSQFNKYGNNPTRYEVPMFTKGKPSLYRADSNNYGDVWVVSKPGANLEWESVKGAAVSPRYNGEFNKAPISEFEFYQYNPDKGYVKLDDVLNLPDGIQFSRTPHIDYLKSLSEQQQIEYLIQNGLNDQWLWTLKNNPEHLESALRNVHIPNNNGIRYTDSVRTPQITVENAASMTPEQWTAAQDAAIARGDMAEAQRLRDLHFKVSAPNTQIKDVQYHGAKGNAKFNVFNPELIGQTDKGWAGRGYYFTPSIDYAKMYGSEPRAFYINAQKVHDGTASTYFGREDSPAARVFKIIRKKHGNDGQQILDELASSDAIRTSFSQTQPYNGIFEEVVTRNNNQMKLADAVTYDNNGVRIPLGERDNFNINDIRYGLLPIIGGIGLGNYSDKKRNGGSIHIAPSKRGTFTAAATKHGMSVQEFASRILRNKNDYSPSLVKKANFARNASKWH